MNINTKIILTTIITISLACIGVHLWDYLLFPTHFIVGLCLIPLLITKQHNTKTNYWYVAGGLFFLTMSLLVHIITLYYIGLAFILILILNTFTKSNNHLSLALVLIISPAFTYLKNAIGIPIRLLLSDASASILSLLQPNVILKGNLVSIGNDSFMIDQACAGLNMLSYTLIIGILVLGIIQNKEQINWSFWQLSFLIIDLISLSIFSNLLRILILIQFKILPDNPIHYYAGVICMITVALIPFSIFCWWLSKFIKKTTSLENQPPLNNYQNLLTIGLLITAFVIGFWVKKPIEFKTKQHVFKHQNQYKTKALNYGVTKFYNDSLLIYEKPLQGLYSAEHSPMICWKGSGYTFKNINIEAINHQRYYIATLTNKDNNKLYTAWWFESNNFKTIDQLEWRLNCFKTNDHFSLINVTTESKHELFMYLSKED